LTTTSLSMLDLLVTRRGNPSDAESGEFTPSARDLSPQMGGLSNREALSPRENAEASSARRRELRSRRNRVYVIAGLDCVGLRDLRQATQAVAPAMRPYFLLPSSPNCLR
jgi:hypothetical protein